MKVRLTSRRLAVLAAIHEHSELCPAAICRATGAGPAMVYPALDAFVLAGWLSRKPHPTRPGVSVYHLTLRGQLGAGLQPKGSTP